MEKLPSTADATADPSDSRYELVVKIASGGMATVYVGRIRGAAGFWRLVAIKRAHAHLIENPTFKQMLVDEARLASRLHHPNVVAVLDVEELAGELRLVMDYVEGGSLSDLLSRGQAEGRRLPARVAVRVSLDACAGLHAAHELCDEDGKLIGLVHRDVSPHNILVGADGVGRLSDFGIAKQAEGGVSTTTGALKGKLGYMAPEYVEEGKLDARSDVFALGVVVWEALAGEKLFRGNNEVDTLKRIVATKVPPLSSVAPWVGKRLDAVLATALARSPDERFATAQAFGNALETAARRDDLIATPAEVGTYVREILGPALDKRKAQIRERTAPVRTEPTVRVVRPPSEPEEVPAAVVQDRTAVMVETLRAAESRGHTPAPVEAVTDGGREASNITLKHTASLATNVAPAAPQRRGVMVMGALALAVGGVGAVALQWMRAPAVGGAGAMPAPTVSAVVTATAAATVVAVPIATASATASAVPSATAAAVVTARPLGRPRASATVDGRIAPNPYAKP